MMPWNKILGVVSIIVSLILLGIGLAGIAAISIPEVAATSEANQGTYVIFCCFPAFVFFVLGLALFKIDFSD